MIYDLNKVKEISYTDMIDTIHPLQNLQNYKNYDPTKNYGLKKIYKIKNKNLHITQIGYSFKHIFSKEDIKQFNTNEELLDGYKFLYKNSYNPDIILINNKNKDEFLSFIDKCNSGKINYLDFAGLKTVYLGDKRMYLIKNNLLFASNDKQVKEFAKRYNSIKKLYLKTLYDYLTKQYK